MARKITPITAPTQDHLPIADILDDIILTKEGGAALVLKTSSVNFSLLSEQEQEALTYAYAALLNSLSFPIQILIRSHRKDISSYLEYLAEQETKQTNPKLKALMQSYRNFVIHTVKKKNVLEKEFYIVIPFSTLELGMNPLSFFNLFSPVKTKKIPYPKEYVVKKAKITLYPKRDHLIRQTGRLGIKIQQLTTDELKEFFAEIYMSKKTEEEKTNAVS